MDLSNLDRYRAASLAERITWSVERGFSYAQALRDTLTGAAVTGDDVVTLLARAWNDTERAEILAATPLRLLRGVADLTYACDYPDTATRKALLRAIPAALQPIHPNELDQQREGTPMKTAKATRKASPTATDWEVIRAEEIRRDDLISFDEDALIALTGRDCDGFAIGLPGDDLSGVLAGPEDIDWHGIYSDRCVILTTPARLASGALELTYRQWWRIAEHIESGDTVTTASIEAVLEPALDAFHIVRTGHGGPGAQACTVAHPSGRSSRSLKYASPLWSACCWSGRFGLVVAA